MDSQIGVSSCRYALWAAVWDISAPHASGGRAGRLRQVRCVVLLCCTGCTEQSEQCACAGAACVGRCERLF